MLWFRSRHLFGNTIRLLETNTPSRNSRKLHLYSSSSKPADLVWRSGSMVASFVFVHVQNGWANDPK